ncbi:MAG: hypothetical protein J1F18_13565 [Lachnospiraceae bacterium]|nr:hypothetical protein [Lachnospiraceae bacterium]
MKTKLCYIVILLSGILSLSMLTATCLASPDINGNLPSLSAMEVAISSSDGDTERIEALTSLISMYSEQLEEYDRSNGSFVVGCVGLAGVILGLVVNVFTTENKKNKLIRPNYGIATLFALIPGIMTLCLYVFSMQCRRVVFFRGYLTYLEEKLSELIGIPMVFNSNVVGKFFGEFGTMNAGFWVMGIVVVLMLLVSCCLCLYLATPKCFFTNASICSIVIFSIYVIVFIVFTISCIIFVYDLCTNGDIPNQVYQYCLQFSG